MDGLELYLVKFASCASKLLTHFTSRRIARSRDCTGLRLANLRDAMTSNALALSGSDSGLAISAGERRSWRRGLAALSVTLGAVELAFGRALARSFGLSRADGVLVRAYGAREVAAGLLCMNESTAVVGAKARLVGDVLDLATLGRAYLQPRANRGRIALALAFVAGATALDAIAVRRLTSGSGSPQPKAPRHPVRYSDDLETVGSDEAKTFTGLRKVFETGQEYARERYGCPMRAAHAKSFGALKGELRVAEALPPELRQGLFGRPARFPVVARLSHAPFEPIDDRTISSVRGLALKVLGVEGPMLGDHAGQSTQDFLCVTGKVFVTSTAKSFLAFMTTIEATEINTPDIALRAVSATARGAHAALAAAGIAESNLAKVDFMGHPRQHPLSESYFTQMPIRYGDYVAKLGLFPSETLKALGQRLLTLDSPNAIRDAVRAHFAQEGAQYDVRVQLCRDVNAMPIENAATEWPESLSPYVHVGRLVFPPQDAYADARAAFVEQHLSFSPAHTLAAHRPLGSVGRARLDVYPAMAGARAAKASAPLVEPRTLDEIPD